MKITNFIEEGNFYKGNCHCHTTISDGKITPNDIVKAYKEKNYNFLMITDHNIYSNYDEFNQENFITIQGFEGNCENYHFIFFPTTTVKPYEHLERVPNSKDCGINYKDLTIGDINEYVKNICSRGYTAMINHPYWSSIEANEIMQLENIFAVEIYNNGCNVSEDTAESIASWDWCLKKGKKMWAMATDDNHNTHGLNNKKSDSFGGWINVKAKSLSEKDIMASILNGSFYGSQGPEIYDFYVENGYANIKCSKVEKIYMHSYTRGKLQYNFYCHMSMDDMGITTHKIPLTGHESFVKIQIYDYNGKKAYSNPIYLK